MTDWRMSDYAETWQLRHVPRWVAIVSNRRQSVAEHEHGTMVIARWLLDRHKDGWNVKFRLAVFEHLLGHDRDEAITGDHPSPTKPPKSAEGRTQVEILAKCADILEALMFLEEEKMLGNGRLYHVFVDVMARLEGWQQHLELTYSTNAVSLFEEVHGWLIPGAGFPIMQQKHLEKYTVVPSRTERAET